MVIKRFSSLILSAAILFGLAGVSNAMSDYTRIAGTNRYDTSMETQKMMSSDTVVFTNGNNFADSLSAVNICNAYDAKLVLVNGTENMSDFLTKNGIKRIYIVGGYSSIDSSFEEKIKNTGIDATRVYGDNRYDTNYQTLKLSGFEAVGIASGQEYADALSATRFLKEKSLGLMLADKNNLDSIPEGYEIKYVFGGEKAMPYDKAQRISGENRYLTSQAIADMSSSESNVIVSGNNFADALSAINISNAKKASIYIAPNPNEKNFKGIKFNNDGKIYVVGGKSALSDNLVKFAITGDKISSTIENSNSNQNDSYNIDNGKYVIFKSDGKYYIKEASTDETLNYSKSKQGMISVGGKMYFLNKDNSLKEGFFSENGKTYYSTLKDGLARGWKYIDKNLYYFSPVDYSMYKDGIKSTGEGVYWFGKDGKLKTGNRRQGYRGKFVRWYGPTKQELENKWLSGEDAARRFKGQEIANFAASFDGLPFRWFGCDLRDKRGVYCCGAAYSAMKEFGIKIPGPNDCNMYADGGYKMVEVQYKKAPAFGGKYIPTNWNKMWPGDINYSSARPGAYSHAAIYMGKNGGRPIVIHATLADGYIAEPASIITNGWHYRYLNSIRYL